MDAITTMKKEHGEFLPENGEGMDSALIELAGKLWGAVPNGISEPSMDMMPQAEPMSMGMMPEQALPSMDMMPDPAAMPMAAARKQAEGGMKVPSIRKPKDKVKVDKDLGKDTEGDNLPNLPKSFKPSQGKPDGKLSKTDLGKDSEGKDLLPHPEGKPSATHSPKSQSGVSLPNPDLGSDSEPNDAFSVPGQGAKPSVKHKQ
jgi:hypothetical protein